ncbi:helix-turn-helix transcriptional regulator [Amycolatopsis nigrescens]|uniref:helix-turn-helix transcriptional regulator n=1 Tax=Amycolatopsis nigrescens TaxID=381445 RepID=UPI000362FD6A|nr:LuxR C-terminal-related transcriptional regulator [Amycolatopsis nigrescens]
MILTPTTRRLVEQAADPAGRYRIAIVAPGGYGKSTLLDALGRRYREAGVEVLGLDAPSFGESTALLVDDAHLLGPIRLARLRELVEQGVRRIVLSYRPRPHPALRELAELLDGPPILLPPWQREQVRLALGVDERTADDLCAHTGGVPRFVLRMRTADAESQLEPFRAELACLAEDVLRFLVAAEAGAGRDLDLLADLLGRDRAGVAAVIDDARATGMLTADGVPLPIVRRAIRGRSAVDLRLGVLHRLVEIQLRHGRPLLMPASALLGTAASGPTAAAAFETAAREAMPADPVLATELFEAAAEAGRPVARLAPAWARAAALAGELDTALRLSDDLIAGQDAEDRAAGAGLAATVLAHRGELARSAELYQWSARGSARSFAVVGLTGTGRLDAARALLSAPMPDSPPTLLAGAATRMARGIAESVTGQAGDALTTLLGAAAMLEPAGPGVLLPDSPAALAAIVALHAGELALAESVLTRALAGGTGGHLLTPRHRLLLGWVAMTKGELTTAATQAAVARQGPTQPRDELFLAALDVGIARRSSDIPGLRLAWDRAYQAVMRQQVDLFVLLPLGELAIAAARLGEHAKLAQHRARVQTLLAELGQPPLWSAVPLWQGLHAAITMEDKESAEEHLALLAGHTYSGRYCSVLFGAAQSWLAVLAGTAAPEQVADAAGELARTGLRWDAARLAGQAAIRTSDRKAMVLLLEAARQFQGKPRHHAPSTPASDLAPDLGSLSEREQEVARLVVSGLTYKQVGQKLFISGKTVEHHMARIRAKIGAGDRRELLATLRELLDRKT